MLNKYIRRDKWSPDDLVSLQNVYNSLTEGEGKWEHYFKQDTAEQPEQSKGKLNVGDMKKGDPETHQDHKEPESGKPKTFELDEPPEEELPQLDLSKGKSKGKK